MRKPNETPLFHLFCLLIHFPSISYLFCVYFVSVNILYIKKYKSSVVRNCNSLILQPERGEQPKTYVMRLQKATHYYI